MPGEDIRLFVMDKSFCTGFGWEFSTYFPSLCRHWWRVAQTLKVDKKTVPTCEWRSPCSPLGQIKLLPASSEREMSDGCSLGVVSLLSFPGTAQMPDMGALRAVISPVFLHCCCHYFNLSLNLSLAAKGAVMCSGGWRNRLECDQDSAEIWSMDLI